jgi:predicted GNAT superfamily acetyltransferase
MADWEIRQLETPESLEEVEALQDVIWPGNQVEIVPVHVFCCHT